MKVPGVLRFSLWRILVFCALLFIVRLAEAVEIIPDQTTIAYYEITGTDASELRGQLNRFGPFDAAGTRHDARTIWYISWTWPSVGGKSNLSQAQVVAKVLIIMPKLGAESQLEQSVKDRWNNYLIKLKEHEDLHAKIALDCRNEMEAELKKTKGEDGESVAQRILKKYKDLEVEMDKRTNHGINDGAKFP